MEENVKHLTDFLRGFSAEELFERKVLVPVPLHGEMQNLLKTNSVYPLLSLMREENVKELVIPEIGWLLRVNGDFVHLGSKEKAKGNIESLKRLGAVFDSINTDFNPYSKIKIKG